MYYNMLYCIHKLKKIKKVEVIIMNKLMSKDGVELKVGDWVSDDRGVYEIKEINEHDVICDDLEFNEETQEFEAVDFLIRTREEISKCYYN